MKTTVCNETLGGKDLMVSSSNITGDDFAFNPTDVVNFETLEGPVLDFFLRLNDVVNAVNETDVLLSETFIANNQSCYKALTPIVMTWNKTMLEEGLENVW